MAELKSFALFGSAHPHRRPIRIFPGFGAGILSVASSLAGSFG